jgi:quercetin dioxygenase-like cupin family protein
MDQRRGFLRTLAGLFVYFGARIPAKGAAEVKMLAKQSLGSAHPGMEATLVEVTISPGAGSAVHRHPGFVLGYVLEGAMRFAVDGGAEQVINAGGTFYEPPAALHTASASAIADRPVKILAFMVAKQGSPVTIPK